jgi:hypothetical protein
MLPAGEVSVSAPHMVLSFAFFRALLRYVSRTDTSCNSPQCGQSSFSILSTRRADFPRPSQFRSKFAALSSGK